MWLTFWLSTAGVILSRCYLSNHATLDFPLNQGFERSAALPLPRQSRSADLPWHTEHCLPRKLPITCCTSSAFSKSNLKCACARSFPRSPGLINDLEMCSFPQTIWRLHRAMQIYYKIWQCPIIQHQSPELTQWIWHRFGIMDHKDPLGPREGGGGGESTTSDSLSFWI